jgi:hypothetical protein
MASRYPKAYRSITSLCFAVDTSDQGVSRYCKRFVSTVQCLKQVKQVMVRGHSKKVGPGVNVT